MAITVAGSPQFFSIGVSRVPQRFDCPKGKELCIRNTGINTVWVSLDGSNYFDVACGTSFDVRAELDHFWMKTKIGKTTTVALVTS